MKKSFDQLFNEVLGQNILGQAPKIATTNTANKPNQPQQNQPASNQQAQQNQQQQPDPELENAFKTLLTKAGANPEHQKAIQALQQLLAQQQQQQQQQNAANKPA
jgi:hypothetical protein